MFMCDIVIGLPNGWDMHDPHVAIPSNAQTRNGRLRAIGRYVGTKYKTDILQLVSFEMPFGIMSTTWQDDKVAIAAARNCLL